MPKRPRPKSLGNGTECDARIPSEIFSDFQEAGSYLTEKLQSELEAFYKSQSGDEDLFENFFYKPVLVLLHGTYSSPFVKKLIPFIVEFLVGRLAEEDLDEERETISPFLAQFFDFFWKMQSLDDKNMRYNVCKIISQLLARLAEKDISMDEALCEKISLVMISERITDKAVDIRELAAKSLQWLQDSTSPQCHVTKTLMFHLDKDPSVEVRKTILSLIRVSSVTLPSIVKRTRDINDSVRVMAYKILAERRKINSLSYSLREKIIISGLHDTSAAVREATESYLLPKWVEHLQGDLVEFINNLDVHYRPSVPRQALPHLFKTKTTEELLAFLKVTEGEKYPQPETLTPALALYWSSLAKYFKDSDESEALEKILGSVTELTNYINCYYTQEIPKDMDLIGEEQKEENVLRITVLLFLLDLFSFCDMNDEVGRKSMADFLLEILNSDDHRPDRRLLTKVTSQLSVGIPDPYNRVDTVVNMLTDMYNPYVQPQIEPTVPTLTDDQKRALNVALAFLKKDFCNLQIAKEKAIETEKFTEAEELKSKIAAAREEIKKKEEELKGPIVLESQDDRLERKLSEDPAVQYKCLVILCELLKNPDVFEVSLGFADIIEQFVVKCVAIDHEHIVINALEALGLYCMHSEVAAIKHLPMFYVVIMGDVRPFDSVKAKCLQCIGTLLVLHGSEKLSIPNDEWNVPAEATKFDMPNKETHQFGYLVSIISNMTNEIDLVKRHAIVATCQLLLSGRIKSYKLLAKIILLWFLPSTSANNYLVKLIGQFLSCYAADNDDAPQMLTQALLFAIDEIVNCSHSSDLQELDPKEVGLFILDLTKPGTNKYSEENHHDRIARILLEKLETEDKDSEAQPVFLRLLVNLAISYDDSNVRKSLLEILRRVKTNNLADSKNKDLLKLLLNLQGRPEGQMGGDNVSSTPRSPTFRRTLITDKENMITPIRKAADTDDDEAMDSDDESVFKTPPRRSIRT